MTLLDKVYDVITANTRLALSDATADPTANGQIQRNGSDVKIYSGGSVRNASNIGGGGGGGGAVEVIETIDAAGQERAEFTSLSTGTYRAYSIIMEDISHENNGQVFGVQFSNDGGTTWATGSSAYSYAYRELFHGSATNIQNSTGNNLIEIASNVGNAAGEGVNGEIMIVAPQSSASYTSVTFEYGETDQSGAFKHADGAGRRTTVESNDAVRMEAGGSFTFDDGTFTLLGIK